MTVTNEKGSSSAVLEFLKKYPRMTAEITAVFGGMALGLAGLFALFLAPVAVWSYSNAGGLTGKVSWEVMPAWVLVVEVVWAFLVLGAMMTAVHVYEDRREES